MCEPLRGKKHELNPGDEILSGLYVIDADDVKSAVEGLIQWHEEVIENCISALENSTHLPYMDFLWEELQNHYKSIQAIEHWFEDVIE